MYMSMFASLKVKAKFIIFPSTPYQSDSPSELVAKLAALISFTPCQPWKGPQDSAITWAPETCQHPSAPRPAVLLQKQRPVWEAVALRRVCNQEKHTALAVEDRWCHYGNCMLGTFLDNFISVVGGNPLAPRTEVAWHWHEWEMGVN